MKTAGEQEIGASLRNSRDSSLTKIKVPVSRVVGLRRQDSLRVETGKSGRSEGGTGGRQKGQRS